ncbi:MAG: carboxypeptidase-like regulatory domain-containing protein [Bacteroidales bacterium]|jgi:hypothetical protein|nr:carboxypeptidase-like regulatory domain-containing protein [Bacteroidales bacterium]
MKIIKTLPVSFILLVILVFSSCKEQYIKPIINFSPDKNNEVLDFTSVDNIEIAFDIKIISENEIKNISISEYIYEGDTIIEIKELPPVEGYAGKLDFNYHFTKTYIEKDFKGRSKIDIVFTVFDNKGQSVEKFYRLTHSGKYVVDFIITDTEGTPVDDAVIKLGETINDTGIYKFIVSAGNYNYEVSKNNYNTLTDSIKVENISLEVNIQLETETDLQ